MGKIMFCVIPEMPSKTFVMVLKKIPDHFKYSHGNINGNLLLFLLHRIELVAVARLAGLAGGGGPDSAVLLTRRLAVFFRHGFAAVFFCRIFLDGAVLGFAWSLGRTFLG